MKLIHNKQNLESLKNMKNIERIFLSNTHINRGLEYLPENCRELYCDSSDHQYGSTEIVKELSKYLKTVNGKHTAYYDLDE